MRGLVTAAVFKAILSAPAFKNLYASSTDLIPPPTVIGMKTFFPEFFTKSNK